MHCLTADGIYPHLHLAGRLMAANSLILLQQPAHQYLRGLLQPAFSAQAIAGHLPAIQQL